MSRDSSVDIGTDYGLHGPGVGVRVPIEARFVSSPRRPHRLWVLPILLYSEYRGSFPGDEHTRAWASPLTTNYFPRQENVDYISTPPYAILTLCLIGRRDNFGLYTLA
jgi:hypothetical protein